MSRFCYEKAPLKRAQNGSRLSAGSLRYAIAHSGGTGDGIRFPSKCFQSFEIAVYLSVAVKRIVVVRTEVMESSLVFKNVVYGDQHGMGDCKRGSIFATSSRNSLVLCKEIRTLYGFCRLCTLRQNRFEWLSWTAASAYCSSEEFAHFCPINTILPSTPTISTHPILTSETNWT